MLAEQRPQAVVLEHAQRAVGQRLDAVGRHIAKLLLQPDQIAGQQEVEIWRRPSLSVL